MRLEDAITSTEMRIIDRNTDALGVSTLLLMENAGRCVADVITSRLGSVENKRIVVFAGAGGKAGDGITAARHLASRGARVLVYMLTPPDRIEHEATRIQYSALEKMDLYVDIKIVKDLTDIPEEVEADVVIDALLGIGVRGRVRTLYAKAIECINKSRALKVSIDIPSGIDPDTGEVLGVAVKADITVTLHKPKVGLLKAKDYAGDIVVVDIGIPREAELYVGPGDLEYRYRPRPMKIHKGWAGRVLIIGGSETFTGAPALAGLAALRAGVDLVYIAAPERAANIIASFSPDLITIRLVGEDHLVPQHVEILSSWIERSDVVLIGPGLGQRIETALAVRRIIELCRKHGKPMVIDADGLKALINSLELLGPDMVITPHAGEFKLLFGTALPDDVYERMSIVKETAKKYNVVILLKGWIDIISDGTRLKLNKVHAPAMTVGGTGDTLSGIVAALIARKLSLFEAAMLGAFINGLAGCIAYHEVGDHMVASDILRYIPEAMNRPYENFKKYLVYKRIR